MAKNELPAGASRLAARQPEAWKAFAERGEAMAIAGPLAPRTRRLVSSRG